MSLKTPVPIATTVSIAALIVYTLVLDVKPSDITVVGLRAIIITSLLALARLIVQGIRFYLIAKSVAGYDGIRASGSILIRMASEFVALITPSYMGGEAMRIAWLKGQGIPTGRAIWAAYLEVLFDVIAGTTISIVASIIMIQMGAYFIGGVALLISCTVLGLYLMLAIVSMRRIMKLPGPLMKFLRRLSEKRAEALKDLVERAVEAYNEAASSLLRRGSLPNLFIITITTMVMVVLTGTIFWLIVSSAGVKLDLFFSILAVYTGITLGTVPITVGGSGLSELGASLFTSVTLGSRAWGSVIAWRIVSYHVPLAITSVALVWAVYKKLKP
ncbi:MAG: flippase-like domain-containing protein [Nitrososphaerota archaeon]